MGTVRVVRNLLRSVLREEFGDPTCGGKDARVSAQDFGGKRELFDVQRGAARRQSGLLLGPPLLRLVRDHDSLSSNPVGMCRGTV